MQYFLSHLIYIVIAAVIIGLIGFLAVWAADKSAAMDREKKEDGELKGLEQLENIYLAEKLRTNQYDNIIDFMNI